MNSPRGFSFSPRLRVMSLLLIAALPAVAVLVYFSYWMPLGAIGPEAHASIIRALLGLCILTALVLALGWFTCYRLFLTPIQPVLNTLRKVASGDLSARTVGAARVEDIPHPPHRDGEISRLAYEVDRMAEALSQRDKALTEARDRAQAYLDIVGVMVLALNDKGNIALANRKTCEVLNCGQPQSCIGGNWFDKWIPADQRQQSKARFAACLAGNNLAEGGHEGHILTASGKRRLIVWHDSPITDKNGQVIGMLRAGEDITDVRQTQQALLDSRDRYRALVENIPGVVYRCSAAPPWHMEFISPLIETLTGIAAEHFIDDSVRYGELIHPDDHPGVARTIEDGVAERRPFTCEYRIRRNDGAWRWVHEQGQAILDGAGSPICLDGVIVDITREIASREEQKRLQTQLQQAQKMEALGQLTGGIAHDFNNILAAVLGFAKLALHRQTPDPNSELAEYLREVITAGERARDLVARMLAFSRAQPGRAAQSLAPLPLAKEAVKLLQATIPASIRIDSRFEENLPDINIDPTAMHQILMNLVINARDALDGKGNVSIGLARRQEVRGRCAVCQDIYNGDFLELTVADDGAGIAPEALLHIFEPFFTTKEAGRGTGMGLATVHGLVHRAGGHIQVESSVGQGARFRVYLPVATSHNDAAALPAQPLAEAEGNGRHALIVDDETAILRLLHATLLGAGWRVSCFASPRQALAVFRDSPDEFDALICDQAMPDMTGIELIGALHELRPQLPAILCTGFSEDIDEADARQLGVSHFLQKPVDTEVLLAALAACAVADPQRARET